ncbi:MAG TPA: CDP-diacylglycerol--glycerol-3-phosphate 3-phosphatidyltransferase [Candidatus Acetothermia bacterium]|nr:CDP-diacylglycerol--glycerol-3-phosphate 3-phosphatidyltransferase [Candidatus Bipolaricaulota bacterium]RLE40246.1 MAG: CDP-diacylglycerol--glycerol-3-phosphate 3-phosphatidyltransferase [Candidatus Acetothermia bacterium]HDJ29690.1 CDP-diacylglycerol--glycerol-3-phosphate 3-phosphatidyltransferase [Candidatus Acetothermia bacterium]
MTLTIPNQITLARIASVPLFMYFVLHGTQITTILAITIFSLAAISDAVDGYLARSMRQTTVFGKFADPIADKLLIAGALISFVQLGELDAWGVMVIISREFLVTGLRILAIAEGKVIAASPLGKLKTVSHIGLVLTILATRTFSWGAGGEAAKAAFLYLAITLAIVSAGEYFYRSRYLFV